MSKILQKRAMYFGVEPNRYIADVNRWAFIVGISKYEYNGLDLKYAHNDANELYDLIRTPSGGWFEEKRIRKFINEEATTSNITSALRTFLHEPDAEDLVLIYFACHGAPDPQRTNVVYMLTHDTDPRNIPGTALPMREIESALRDNLLAERVIIIADTCHSAAVGGKTGLRSIGDSAVINRYLQDLSETKAGLALLTSAQTNESSMEGNQWGGGHGVFTHFLLEGMRGKADRNPKDGTVTVGELFEYVRDEVKRETNDAQHPVIGPHMFDPKLPLAVTGGISAEEHLLLGCCLTQLGWLLNEPPRFAFARSQLQEALRLAKRLREKLPEALLQKALTEMALGDNETAEITLREAIKDDKKKMFPEAHLHLGVALARLGKRKLAASSFRKFSKLHPDDVRADWVRGFVTRLTKIHASGRVHVLLIGIGRYIMSRLNLRGPVNDIRAMKDLLVGHYGIAEVSIRTMMNSEATQRGIVAELERLQAESNPEDRVLVYFSGHAFQGNVAKDYLIPFDYDENDPRSVTALQLHNLLNAIPSHHTTMIIDSHASKEFIMLAQGGARYRLLLGTSPQQMAYETRSDDGLMLGRFTDALVKQLAQNPPSAALDRILEGVAKVITTLPQAQQPVFIGDMSAGLLTENGGFEDFLEAYNFSLQRNYNALSLSEIRAGYARCEDGASFPQLYLNYGRAFLEKGEFSAALDALTRVASGYEKQVPEALLILGIAQLHNQDYEAALTSLGEYTVNVVDAQKQMEESLRILSELKNQRRHALLVGIDRYQEENVTPLRGAVNDVQLVKKILVEKYNFMEEDIQLITDDQATRGAIDAAFDALIGKAQHAPALFYFAGYGSLSLKGEPTIVPVDWGAVTYSNDITLRDLAVKSAAAETNLVTIIDAGWKESIRIPYGRAWGSRFIPPQSGIYPLSRGLTFGGNRITQKRASQEWQPDSGWLEQRERVDNLICDLKIGRISIYNVSIQSAFGNQRGLGSEPVVEAEFSTASGSEKQIHGVLTHAMMDVLRQEETSSLTYHELVEATVKRVKWLEPFVVGDNLAEVLFCAPVQEQKVHDFVYTRMRNKPIRQAIQLINRLIEKSGGKHTFGNLNLAIAHAALGEYEKSRVALKKAIEESGRTPIPEAHYYLGRVLYEMGEELDLSISELRKALEEDPHNVSANYFFGHAARERTERKTLVEAVQAFEVYLENGAPLGNREEVKEVLDRWSNGRTAQIASQRRPRY